MNEFTFQAAEEILRNGVVVRVSPTRHTLTDTAQREAFPIGSGGVLDAAVRVENEFNRLIGIIQTQKENNVK